MPLSTMLTGRTPEKDLDTSNSYDEEELEDEPRNLLLALASQLRIGMDLSKVVLPTFVLESRSTLERLTDFLSHPNLIFESGKIDSKEERFIRVLRYYLAGWHIKPKGVKKPYNPILGEIFRCIYSYPPTTSIPTSSKGFYIAEQVSHHPPISAWFYVSPENKLSIFGEFRPKSKFLGNSAATIMEGASYCRFLDRDEDGEYKIGMPTMYARGILFGKMVLELGDTSAVRNTNNGFQCDIEFKTKGFFSGSYNCIAGKIRSNGNEIGEISGKWNEVMEIKRNGKSKEILFDGTSEEGVTPKNVTKEESQLPNESRRLWSGVTAAIRNKDHEKATVEKTAVEDGARDSARAREDGSDTAFVPKYFHLVDGEWRCKFQINTKDTLEDQITKVETFIWGTDTMPIIPVFSP